jgi:hypothetical protein
MSGSDRTRRYRKLRGQGRCVLYVRVDEHAVAKTALELGLLSPAEARQRENLARVVEGLDTSWTERELVRGLTAAQ